MPFVLTSATQAELRRCLSQPRLGTYEAACGHDFDVAMDLYVWNGRAAAAFYEAMHLLEVGFRNTVDQALSAHWSATWYKDAGIPLTPGSRTRVREAIGRATAGGAPEIPGRVVAELNFGFWWSLLAETYNRSLWQPCLRAAFPPTVRRGRLHGSLDEMRRLRNRCAHHEPIFDRNLQADWQTLITITGFFSPTFRTWVESVSRVPAVIAAKPIP